MNFLRKIHAKFVIASLDEVKAWQSTTQKAVAFAIFRNAI